MNKKYIQPITNILGSDCNHSIICTSGGSGSAGSELDTDIKNPITPGGNDDESDAKRRFYTGFYNSAF